MSDRWKVHPGEVDHEIDLAQLDLLPLDHLDGATERACEAIFTRFVAPGEGGFIPRPVFCDVPRGVFLDFVGHRHGVLMAAERSEGEEELAPVVVSQSLIGWDRPRHVAFRRGVEAIVPAILDRARLKRLGHGGQSAVTWPFADPERPANAFYFGFDYRALPEGPWRRGVVSLYRATDFPDDLWTRPFLSSRPIRPLARIAVEPQDWPLLDRVEGIDPATQEARMREAFRGFPWRDDVEVHPGRWRRVPAERMRRHLDAHPDEPADLSRLGALIGQSPSAALRTFRATFGQSPHEYTTRARIALAKTILQRGASIGETAAESGFCDQSHLTAHFRRALGLTPAAYLRTQESPIL